MNIFKTMMCVLQEWEVELPRQVSGAVLNRGIEMVVAMIEEQRREEEEHWRRLREEWMRNPNLFKGSGRMCKTDSSDGGSSGSFRLFEEPQRRPPDLNAPVLSFSARLLKYVKERCGGSAPMAYKRAGIDRKLYSKIVSDDRSQVSKRTALRFVIGLQLSRAEADAFLQAAGYSLSPTIPEDRVFEYCIEHGIWNIKDVNDFLVKCGLGSLDLHL